MTPQEMRRGMLTIASGMRHSGFASSREIVKRLAGLVGSGENAMRVVAEAERIGLIAPEPFPEDPASPDRMWRLVGGPGAGVAGGGAGGPRTGRVGTLARFVAYLGANDILADIEAPRGYHMLHKYAYIAKGLGMRLDYEFDFLENGAFSVELELDLFKLEGAGGGTEPFEGNARASAAFLDLVRDRDAKWLQAATFAMRERGRDGALEDFMAIPQAIIKHDAGTVRNAFAGVEGALRAVAVEGDAGPSLPAPAEPEPAGRLG